MGERERDNCMCGCVYLEREIAVCVCRERELYVCIERKGGRGR